ncbi:unnamed protein product [Chironomus riparius]|uniref:Uncharacterized protein n=1 Tax=Chironomus riparius TaxID=315576 RepID=A0A9N9WKL4_9DIPT|nr:unnamed protein product [Chironomus riparius]
MSVVNLKTLCLLLTLCLFNAAVDSQFINVQRTSDGKVIFLCNSIISTIDDISYEWYNYNDKLIRNDSHYEVVCNKLILKKLHTNLPLYYKCVIELKTIGAKFAVTKKIENRDVVSKLYRNKRHKNEALKFITSMMPNKNFELGSTGKIHCKATGSKSIFWKNNQGDELPNNVVDVNGTLIFNNVDISMKGIYTCIASNDNEQISHQIEVRILPAFEVIPPDKLFVNELEPVILHCTASGSPMPTIKWDFETKMINSNGRFQIYDNGSLFIQESHLDDSGRYGCIIGSYAGFKRSETFLTVKQADSQKEENDSLDETNNLLSNKAVLITCSLAIIYIICVVVLMIWCRQRRGMKRQIEIDPENLKLHDENETHAEKSKHKTLVKSLSSSFTFDIRHEKITEIKKIGIDSNFKMEILIGFLSDSDLPSKIIMKDNAVTDEIKMQQQTKVLIKTIRKDQDERTFIEFRRQVDLFCNVDSENVVKLFGLSKESKIYGIIIEHDNELKSLLTERVDISVQELLKFCHQLVAGIEAIHKKAKLTHRDISLINCIVTKENVLKLTSKASTDNSDYYEFNSHLLHLRYTAPELFSSCISNGEIDYTYASDIYACGITMCEILNKGNQAFKSLGKEDFVKKLQARSLDYNILVTSTPSDISEILLKCLKNEANERIDSNDLLNCLEEAMTRNN